MQNLWKDKLYQGKLWSVLYTSSLHVHAAVNAGYYTYSIHNNTPRTKSVNDCCTIRRVSDLASNNTATFIHQPSIPVSWPYEKNIKCRRISLREFPSMCIPRKYTGNNTALFFLSYVLMPMICSHCQSTAVSTVNKATLQQQKYYHITVDLPHPDETRILSYGFTSCYELEHCDSGK